MKAFIVEKYQKNGDLKFAEIPSPQIEDNQVLIEIKASAVNLLDSKIRDGEFKLFLKYKPPFALGHDVAGIVTKTGRNVTKFKVGDEVFSRPRDGHQGTFAELIAVHEDDLALKPKNLEMNEAASIPLVGLTAWQALVEIGQVKAGQKVFIQAGSGGVGTFAIQLAKHLGAHVATTTSSKNFSLVKNLGADEIIDYKTQDFESVLINYDFVLHSQDSEALKKSLRILRPGGVLVSISGPPDPAFADQIGLNLILKLVMRALSRKVRRTAAQRNLRYHFLFMRADGQQLSQIADLLEKKIIRPVLDKIYPFSATAEALKYVEAGRAAGKVVIDVQQNEIKRKANS